MSENSKSNSLAIYKDMGNPLEYAERMGKAIAKSGIIECQQEQTGTIIALHCISEGIDAIAFDRKYNMINGHPSQRASSMLADFEASGGTYDIVEASPKRAAIKMTYGGRTIEVEATWDEMQLARWPWKDPENHKKGLKTNWSTPEDQENQLWSRLISKWCKRIAPQLFYGTYSPEEMRDAVEGEIVSVEATPPLPTIEELAEKIDSAAEVAEAETTSTKSELKDTINDLQMGRIMQLKGDLGMTADTFETVVFKRNVKSLREFSSDQGNELIEKMETMVQSK